MSLRILAKMEVGYRGRLCHPASSDLFAAIPHGRRDSLCALSVHAETGKRVPNTFSTEGGMFSGVNQALKETTVTLDWKVADGFVIRPEWWLDWSNRPSFLTDTLGTVSKQQNTPGFGLVWWLGGKEGAW